MLSVEVEATRTIDDLLRQNRHPTSLSGCDFIVQYFRKKSSMTDRFHDGV